jgi:hypothetical protein
MTSRLELRKILWSLTVIDLPVAFAEIMCVELSVITRKIFLFKDFSRCLSSDFSSRVKARLSWCIINYKILDPYLGIYLPSWMFIYNR